MKPFGDGFIKLIKMIIAPVIFCTVVTGIAGMEDMKKVGKTGGLAILYFEVVALLLSSLVSFWLTHSVPAAECMLIRQRLMRALLLSTPPVTRWNPTAQFLMNIIPNTVVSAFAEGNILQVLFFLDSLRYCFT